MAVPATMAGAVAALGGAVLIAKLGAVLLLLDGAILVALLGIAEARSGAGPVEGPAMAEGGVRMEGKGVLVTGVGREGQVGYAVAEAFVRAGARVLLTNVHDTVESLATRLAERYDAADRVFSAAADLTRGYEVERLMNAARGRLGGLDALVHVAGGLSVIKPIGETSEEEWEREMERNARTTFLVCRYALPLLRRRRGSIVTFASPAAVEGGARMVAYAAAKAAVLALTRSLALEEAEHGVRVNAILPGLVDTAQNRAAFGENEAHWVTREEVASVALFLASDAASGVSGEAVRVLGDGLAG